MFSQVDGLETLRGCMPCNGTHDDGLHGAVGKDPFTADMVAVMLHSHHRRHRSLCYQEH